MALQTKQRNPGSRYDMDSFDGSCDRVRHAPSLHHEKVYLRLLIFVLGDGEMRDRR